MTIKQQIEAVEQEMDELRRKKRKLIASCQHPLKRVETHQGIFGAVDFATELTTCDQCGSLLKEVKVRC